MGFFSGSKSKVKFVEPKTSTEARKRIETISQISPEGIPLQGIAPLSELEQQAIALAGEFLRDDTGEITLDRAIDVAIQIAEQKIDLNTPEIQGIIQEVRKSGDLALNRISRQLQATGTLSTTAGRDIIGRSISETELRTAGALQPILANFRAQRLQATSLVPNLVGAKAGLTAGRVGVGAAAGELQRNLAQRIKDALFIQKREQFEFGTTGQANIAALLLQAPTPVVTEAGPSGLQKLGGTISDIVGIGSNLSGISGGLGSLFSAGSNTGGAFGLGSGVVPSGTLGTLAKATNPIFLAPATR